MTPEIKDITVMRVANGWIIRPSYNMARDSYGESSEMRVARTPGELAQLLTDWAAAQERK